MLCCFCKIFMGLFDKLGSILVKIPLLFLSYQDLENVQTEQEIRGEEQINF